MDCIYIAPLSKALYNLSLPFTHSHTHSHTNSDLAAMQGTNQFVRSHWGLGVLLRETSTCPGRDRSGNPPTARRQLYLLSHIASNDNKNSDVAQLSGEALALHRRRFFFFFSVATRITGSISNLLEAIITV